MGVEGPPSCCASNKDRDVNQLGLAVFVFLNSFLHLLSFRQACFCAVSYVLWPHTSCFLMNAFSWCSHFKQHLMVVCGLCFPHWSIHTAHAWRTCANSSFVGVVLLGSNKHIKCLSWTRAELWWIMITISQSTICVLRKGIKRQCLKWRKQQHLCLASDYITHHVDLLITTGTSLLQWIFCFCDGGILTELSFCVCMKNTKYIT